MKTISYDVIASVRSVRGLLRRSLLDVWGAGFITVELAEQVLEDLRGVAVVSGHLESISGGKIQESLVKQLYRQGRFRDRTVLLHGNPVTWQRTTDKLSASVRVQFNADRSRFKGAATAVVARYPYRFLLKDVKIDLEGEIVSDEPESPPSEGG